MTLYAIMNNNTHARTHALLTPAIVSPRPYHFYAVLLRTDARTHARAKPESVLSSVRPFPV